MTEILSISDLATQYVNEALSSSTKVQESNSEDAFSSILSSAMQMIKETNEFKL